MSEPARGDKAAPYFEHGFWWWYDPARGDWFIGPSPSVSKPGWAA